jgi:hypothetical protein
MPVKIMPMSNSLPGRMAALCIALSISIVTLILFKAVTQSDGLAASESAILDTYRADSVYSLIIAIAGAFGGRVTRL